MFAEFVRRVRSEMYLQRNSILSWPRLIHRDLYYRLITLLERHLYTQPRAQLILIAQKPPKISTGFMVRMMCCLSCIWESITPPSIRSCGWQDGTARRELGIRDDQFVLLLVGNDWRKKGLCRLLDVLPVLGDRQVLLLVVGDDEKFPYLRQIQRYDLVDRVRFFPSRPDVAFYYAAADAYVGPSVEDTFAQPPAEAMACGLAVITSVTNGTAEIITDGMDGLIIQDPITAPELATQIRRLCEDPYFCRWLGENAARIRCVTRGTKTASK